MEEILIYISSVIITLWGIAHIIPTKNVVQGFGDIQRDNKLIITMEWIAEGVFLIFIGLLNIIIIYFGNWQSIEARIVFILSVIFLLIMSIISLFTGAKTKIFPIKLCPIVKSICAILIMLSFIV